ncbi:unnamed protein product [Cunninghamella blakesleeana]
MSSRVTNPKAHQRKISLTTACPPSPLKQDKRASSNTAYLQWFNRLWRSRLIRWLVYTYVVICMLFYTSHILSPSSSSSSITTTPSTNMNTNTPITDNNNNININNNKDINIEYNNINNNNKDIEYIQKEHTVDTTSSPPSLKTSHTKLSNLNQVNTQLQLGKMFGKSMQIPENVKPFWFPASEDTPISKVGIVTVLTIDDMEALEKMADQWQGSISAVVQIEAKDFNSGQGLESLMKLRMEYQTRPSLRKYVDIHVVTFPNSHTIKTKLQGARNLARFFSRSTYIMYTPIDLIYIAPIELDPVAQHYLDKGDALVVPTFAFPRRSYIDYTIYPKTKDELIEWANQGKIGILDYHWNLNFGPTNYMGWVEATDPYLVTDYDYHYGPVYIITKENHPWCEERFDDQLPACVYTTFLNGADFWVLPNDFIIRSGIQPENHLTDGERAIQDGMYKNFRIEQCAFYARQFDQYGIYDSERANHVKQECAKALRKEKIVRV